MKILRKTFRLVQKLSIASVLLALPGQLIGETIYGLTTDNRLLRFESAVPSAIIADTPITGLNGESLLGIDVRPGTPDLFGVSDANVIYLIDPATGAATPAGAEFSESLSGVNFGFDFNPAVDRIRLVSDAAQNLRLNPNDGSLTAVDGMLAYNIGDPFFGIDPAIIGVGYDSSATLYGMDFERDVLVRITPANDGVLQTVGFLGSNISGEGDLDFSFSNGSLYGAFINPLSDASAFYTVDTGSGAVSMIGSIGENEIVRGIAAAPVNGSNGATSYVVNTADDVVAADGFISLREAIQAANSNTAMFDAPAGQAGPDTVDMIQFDSSLSGQAITLTGGALSVSDALRIENNGSIPLIIDAQGTSRALQVMDGAGEVYFSNVTFSGGISDTQGGAIFVDAGEMLTLVDVNILNSTAADGGGIYNDGGTVLIVGGLIDSNIANGESGSGGGIFNNTGGFVEITGTTITNNQANRAGGGIEDNSGEGLGIMLTHVVLDNNNAGVAPATAAPGNGGGLHITGTGDITITGGSASGNVAAREGGGLWNGGGLMTLDGTMILSNTASGEAADDGGAGVFNNGGPMMISNVTISSNVADGASGSGGGILSLRGEVTVTESSISANIANRAGGGIEIIDGTLILDGVILGGSSPAEGNIAGPAGTAAPGNGGGLHVSGTALITVNGSYVGQNFAAREGGGLWNQTGSTMLVGNGTLVEGNVAAGAAADDGGGGIFNNGGDLTIDGSIKPVVILGNLANGASGSGGGVFSTAGSVVINDSILSANVANRAGGGIELIDGSLTLTDVLLGGEAEGNGNIAGPDGTAAPGNGGGFHVSGVATITVDGGWVVGNVAAREGGGLWNQAGSTMTVQNGAMINNNIASGEAADDGGGGIFNNSGILIIDGSLEPVLIFGNAADGASGSGGGIFNNTDGVVTIASARIFGNVANRAGGGIEDNAGMGVTLTDTYLMNNIAGPDGSATPGNGGGLHVSGAGSVEVSSSTVSGNTAANEGGGLWNSGAGTMSVSVSTVSGNTSPNGGGLFAQAGDGMFEVINSTISGNMASEDGGGIRSEGGTFSLIHTTVAANMATGNGGGVSVVDTSLTSLNTLIGDNVAGANNDFDGTFASAMSTLVEDATGAAGIAGGTDGNIVGQDPALAPLLDFGGTTLTHLPLPGSPVLNTGNATINPPLMTDQRGLLRPVGIADIGAVELQTDENAIVVNTTDDVVDSGDGLLSLREAVIQANGDLGSNFIVLSEGMYSLTLTGGDEDAAMTGDLDITGSLMLLGSGPEATSISAAGLGDRVFEVHGSIMAGVSGVTVTGGTATDGGGIFNRGADLKLSNVLIDGNVANGQSGSGGGIFNDAGGVLTVSDSAITNNQANRAGGGIEDNSGAGLGIILVNVTLDNNNAGASPATAAPGNGGGLHITGAGDTNIKGGSANGNVAASEGGGLWNGSGTMSVSSIVIEANFANGAASDNGGGGIFNNGGTLNVTDAMIQSNVADGASGSGGGLFSTDGAVTVADTLIGANVANRAGGGIELIDGSLELTGVTLGGESTEAGNIAGPEGTAAPGNGGALHITGVATITVDSSTVMNNFAAREGGGLWNQAGSTMTVQNGTVVHANTAAGDAADDGGGGIFNNGGVLNIVGSTAPVIISENIANGASGSGGGVFNQTGGIVDIADSSIIANVANRAGGGIEDNSGEGLGIILSNVTLDSNNAGVSPATAAPGNGGGLHITGPGDVTITGGSANGNVAASEGGGLWNGAGTMTVSGTEVLNNIASGNDADNGGGGIFNNGGTLNVETSTFSENIADGASGSGGGLFSTAGEVTLTGTTISANVANRAGGGIEIIEGLLSLNNITLGGSIESEGNIAGPAGTASPGNGGGLHISGAATISVDGGTVQYNIAAREGGGLWNQNGATMSVLNGTVISDNTALGNAADDGGGGIFNNGGNLIVDGSTGEVVIIRNHAPGEMARGGGVLSIGGSSTISSTTISDNTTRLDEEADDFAESGSGFAQVDGSAEITDTDIFDDVAVAGAATLTGDANITGSLLTMDSSVLSPGVLSSAIMNSGDTSFGLGSTIVFEIGGTSPGMSGHDQIQASGRVNIQWATLDVSLVEDYVPSEGDAIVIINNTGDQSVGGMFFGQPEGSYMWIGLDTFRLSYRDGDGNDVVLRPVGAPGLVNIGINNAPFFNDQTGFVEQGITLNNNSSDLQAGVVVFVNDLPEGVTLANATGTAPYGPFRVDTPFILLDEKLDSTESAVFDFQFESEGDSVDFSPTYSLRSTPDDGLPMSITLLMQLSDGSFLLQFESEDALNYEVQYTSALGTPWTSFPAIVGDGELTTRLDNGTVATEIRFYRVLQPAAQ